MPNRDGNGPEGKGPRTGRGLGPCGDDVSERGMPGGRRGGGRGRGLGLRRNQASDERTDNSKN